MKRGRAPVAFALLGGGLILLGLFGLVAARIWIFNFHRIYSDGMAPGFPKGSFTVSLRHPYRSSSDVSRGDVVVLREIREGRTYDFIWRVVGLPGEHVEVGPEGVSINGRLLPRELVEETPGRRLYREHSEEVSYLVAYANPEAGWPDVEAESFQWLVPPDHLLALGDNRNRAYDGRFAGPVEIDTAIGRIVW